MTREAGGPSQLISVNKLRSARRLLRRKHREETGTFLAEGRQVVTEALAWANVDLLIVGPGNDEIVAAAHDTRVVGADDRVAKQLSDVVTPQGIWAVVHTPSAALSELEDPRLVVICSNVRDPGNAGTIIRCADAFGADAVIMTDNSVELVNPKTVRASVGSIFHLPIVTGCTYLDAVTWAKGNGLQVLAADVDGRAIAPGDPRLARPTAWVMGNEAWGLRPEELAAVDEVMRIPMWGRAESLNLSTAAAVCLFASGSAQRQGLGWVHANGNRVSRL